MQDTDQGLRGYALHTRRHTQGLLPPHPHVHSNISASSSSKTQLEYLIMGYTSHVIPNTSHPDTPDSYTHVQKRRHTKTPRDTLTRTETTLRCLARVRARPGAPACYFSASQPPRLRSSAPGGRRPGLPPPPPPSARCPPKNGEIESAGRESRELEVRRLDRRVEGGCSWMPRGTWGKSP